jgi:hypothetical protein
MDYALSYIDTSDDTSDIDDDELELRDQRGAKCLEALSKKLDADWVPKTHKVTGANGRGKQWPS